MREQNFSNWSILIESFDLINPQLDVRACQLNTWNGNLGMRVIERHSVLLSVCFFPMLTEHEPKTNDGDLEKRATGLRFLPRRYLGKRFSSNFAHGPDWVNFESWIVSNKRRVTTAYAADTPPCLRLKICGAVLPLLLLIHLVTVECGFVGTNQFNRPWKDSIIGVKW